MIRNYLSRANGVTVLAVLVFFMGCQKNGPLAVLHLRGLTSTPYALPSDFFLHASAQRQDEGEVVILGDTNLPDGLKMGVEIHDQRWPPDRDFEILVDHRQFRSRGFINRKVPYSPGKYRVHFLAYFNGTWQKPRLLELIGDGGTKLKPGRLFRLEDPDLIDSDKMLDFWQTIAFPSLSKEIQAISLVKSAVLTTPEGRRSADTVENTIKEFMDPPSVEPARGWSAAKIQHEEYRVLFDFIDGKLGEKQAIWSANLATRQVHYINKSAKILSWLPNH
jgi:hypothetical protein